MQTSMEPRRPLWGLLRRRQCLLPTWRGWIALGLAAALLAVAVARSVHPFLAVNAPVPGGVLVVEGWLPDYALEAAVAEYKRNHYDRMFVTGGPISQGAYLSEYKNYAELGAATLLRLGMSQDAVEAVPAPEVRQDRTYTSAVTLRNLLRQRGPAPKSYQIISMGPHARRTWLLFRKAMGESATVGITAVESREYDPHHWWRSSAGVRAVIDETFAYLYARVLFHPAKEPGNAGG